MNQFIMKRLCFLLIISFLTSCKKTDDPKTLICRMIYSRSYTSSTPSLKYIDTVYGNANIKSLGEIPDYITNSTKNSYMLSFDEFKFDIVKSKLTLLSFNTFCPVEQTMILGKEIPMDINSNASILETSCNNYQNYELKIWGTYNKEVLKFNIQVSAPEDSVEIGSNKIVDNFVIESY